MVVGAVVVVVGCVVVVVGAVVVVVGAVVVVVGFVVVVVGAVVVVVCTAVVAVGNVVVVVDGAVVVGALPNELPLSWCHVFCHVLNDTTFDMSWIMNDQGPLYVLLENMLPCDEEILSSTPGPMYGDHDGVVPQLEKMPCWPQLLACVHDEPMFDGVRLNAFPFTCTLAVRQRQSVKYGSLLIVPERQVLRLT